MISAAQAVYYTISSFGPEVQLTDINNINQFVGRVQSHATIWQDGMSLDFGDLGSDQSYANAINDHGWAVGQAINASLSRPVLWRNGSMEDLGSLDGDIKSRGIANDINKHGDVVGTSYYDVLGFHAFLWQNGTMKNLGTLGDTGSSIGLGTSIATAINDSSHVVGRSTDVNNVTHAFIWRDGLMKDLGTIGRPFSAATDINNLEQVVGRTEDDNNQKRAFLWQNNVMQDLAMPAGYSNTSAMAINDVGQIVGNALDVSNQLHALLWENGEVKNLCDLTDCISAGWDRLSTALSINNNGDIVGNGYINGKIYSFLISVSAEPVNKTPEANAGLDQTVITNTIVQLDGSSSTDPDVHYPLTYAWEIIQKPEGSNATLSDYSIVNPIFITDGLGEYIVELVVTDSKGLASAADTVVISTINSAPVANAGVDQLVAEHRSAVQLDGSASMDVDNDALTYEWSFVERPFGSAVALNDSTIINPVFVVDTHGYYTLQLVVTDSYGAPSVADEIVVSFKNLMPVANAGSDQGVVVGDTVQLMGSGSDVNLDVLTYKWSIVSMPEGSQVTLPVATIHNPSFVPDVAGAYVMSLVVKDDLVDSKPDNVMINAISVQDAVLLKISELYDQVSAIDSNVFKKVKKKAKLLKKINKILDLVAARKYRSAIKKLQHDILKKTDGCFKLATPERNDWVIDCDAQAQLYPVIKEAIDLLQRLPVTEHSGGWSADKEDREDRWEHNRDMKHKHNHKDRKDRRTHK